MPCALLVVPQIQDGTGSYGMKSGGGVTCWAIVDTRWFTEHFDDHHDELVDRMVWMVLRMTGSDYQ